MGAKFDPLLGKLRTTDVSSGAGTGTVTTVSVATANGVSGTVANPTTTPAITLALAAITPTTVNGITLSGSSTPTLAVTGTTAVSGTNTGDQTNISGNAATVTTNANLTGDVTSVGNATTLTNAPVIAKVLTGYSSGAGTVAATDSILQAVQKLNGNNALKAPLDSPTFTGTVTVPTPSNNTDASTKAYVDAVAQGLSVKASVQEATAAALPTNTYLAGVITITATGTLTVDGQLVALNDRVLVKNEVTQANNGIYLCTTAGAIGVAAVLTRATDSNTGAKILGGFVFVELGTVNAASGFVNTNTTAPTIGTTAITYTQFSGAGEITAGNGLSKSGNTLTIDTSITVDKSTAQTLTTKTLTTPKIAQIIDSNGNVSLNLPATASAVNYVEIGNAATTFGPSVVANGTDTNLNLFLRGKGTGSTILADGGTANILVAQGAGGTPVNYTVVINSIATAAPQIQVLGTDTDISLNLVPKGTGRVQSGGVTIPTISSTDTLTNKTLTTPLVTGGASPPSTPAAGSSVLYGRGTSNLTLGYMNESGVDINITGGLVAWSSWSPTITAATGTFTTTSFSGRFIQVGKTVHFQGAITITTIGTGTGCNFTLPVTAQNVVGLVGYAREDATSGKMGVIKFSSSTLGAVIDYVNGNISSGGSGSVIRVNGTYEAA